MGFPLDLLVLGIDTGITLLFYKLYRTYSSKADLVKDATTVKLTPDLIQILEEVPGRNIAYACVEGVVTPVSKVLHSFYTEDEGVMQQLVFNEHRTKRTQGYWHDFTKTLRDSTNSVPFTISNPNMKEACVHVTEPGSADYLNLTTTYDKFEPAQSGLLERGLDRLFGDVSKGFQETENMLKVGAALLGVGQIVLEDGKVKLKPAEGHPYILTEMSKEEVVKKLKSNSTVFKVLSLICGISSVIILGIVLKERYRLYIEHRRFEQEVENIRAASIQRRRDRDADANDEDNSDHNCVICLEQRREVVLLECGHVCLCADCVEQLPNPRTCPICRQTVTRVVPTYNP